ncbi:hypothetical protein E4J66_11940 [Actinomyces viscosus]|uniref:Uncharacterized protein n=1 Tax=Actinomyces viscosus TaxID=1656 RepID=A0A448PKT6_ACTVI|nr:DUF6350 family protein [Actinomyces viscosus]TFH51443.1 hypothetical protein E4J66_11940 [Actinomyces viscosus]VEI15813.1 Uncharacterised protein [Actinomyces viscosus]
MSPERSRVTALTSWTLWSLRVGIESVGLTWLVVVLLTVAVSMATSSLSAAAALSTGEALRAGTALWSLGFGGMITSSSQDQGALSLPLLGLTLVQVGWTWSCVRRARPTRPAAGAAIVVASAAAAVLACLTGPKGLETWPAVGGIAAITGAVVGIQLQRSGNGWPALTRWWERRPHWVGPALSLAYGAARALVLLSLLVAAAAVFTGAGRVSVLHDALAGGGFVSMAGLVLLQLGWVPTLLVWGCSWLIGAGFSVGTGTVFAPDRVVAGPVPTLPLLGLLPTAPLSTVGLWLPLVVTAGAMVAAWRRRSVLNALRVRYAVSAAGLAAVLVAGGVGLLCLAASGSVGPGRMTDVGPQILYTVILVLVEVGVGLAAMAVLAHPYTRTWARGALPESILPASRSQEPAEADRSDEEDEA